MKDPAHANSGLTLTATSKSTRRGTRYDGSVDLGGVLCLSDMEVILAPDHLSTIATNRARFCKRSIKYMSQTDFIKKKS